LRYEIPGALDPELVSEVLRVVETHAKEGITPILVTHETRFARDVSTKLVFMHMGKVHEEGLPKELFAKAMTGGAAAIRWISALRLRFDRSKRRLCPTLVQKVSAAAPAAAKCHQFSKQSLCRERCSTGAKEEKDDA
jgi:ABC-type methionine transport system ATPase subunit